MRLRASRLRRGEWIAGAGSLVLLASVFLLPWYRFDVYPAGSFTHDGWTELSHARWLILVAILSGLALVLFQAARRAPAVPLTLSLATMVLGGLSVLWLLYRVVIDPPGSSDQAGAFVGLVSACTVAIGGYLSLREDGIAPEDGPAEIPTVDPRPAGDS